MKFIDVISNYAAEHDIGPGTITQFHIAVSALERFAGKSLDLSDVTPDLLNRHLADMKARGKADSSRLSRSRDLRMLLRAAIERGDLEAFDFRRVLKVKVRDRIVRAWTPEQVLKLFETASKLQGTYPKIDVPKFIYWRSYILAAWDAALRKCDMLTVKRSWIQADGSFTLVQVKTGHRHRVVFSAETMRAIEESIALAPRDLIWPLWGNRDAFTRAGVRLIKKAGLPGSLKWLRRASATEVEKQHPGTAGRHLGHRTPGLAERNYIDHDQIDVSRPKPRPLTVAAAKGGGE